MKKLLTTAAVLVGIAILARRAAGACARIDWEQKLAAMPDSAPPKWMFTNISAIRENTERIVEMLEPASGDRPGEPESVEGTRHVAAGRVRTS
jgi:hypothetical protein